MYVDTVFGNAEVEVSKARVLEIAQEILKTDLLYLLVKVSFCITHTYKHNTHTYAHSHTHTHRHTHTQIHTHIL